MLAVAGSSEVQPGKSNSGKFTCPRDRQIYPKVEIRDVVWMAPSLNHAGHRHLDSDDDMIWRCWVVKPYALNVRCVQNRSEYDVPERHP
jgi:hypothetical protein